MSAYGALVGSSGAPARRDFVDAWLHAQAADVGPRPQLPVEAAVPTTSTSSVEKRRRRRRLGLARELDTTPLGPDESQVVYSWEDGWTVRRVERLSDQRREGILARHCSRRLSTPLPGEHSLRDANNLPHVTFSAWRLTAAGSAIEPALSSAVSSFLNIELMGDAAARFLAVVSLYHPGAARHLERVREYVTTHREAFPTLPATPAGAMNALAPFIAQLLAQPREAWYRELLRRVELDTDLELTPSG